MKWFKKFQKAKKTADPLWKISTKVVSEHEPVLLRTRKKKSSFGEYAHVFGEFLMRYFRTVGWVVIGGLVMTFGVVVFTTPLFSLKAEKIELILEPEPVFDRAAVMTLMRDFAGKNIFRLSTTEIFTALQSNIRHIQSVEKTLLLPDGIRVRVSSFGPIYRAFIGDEVFLLTKNGQLIADIPEIETSSLRIHHLVSAENSTQNTTLLTRDTFVIQEIERLWYEQLPTFPIEALDYYDQEKELHITSKGTRFILTLSGGVNQLSLISQLIGLGSLNPQRYFYIDVRIPQKLFVCSRENIECHNNIVRIYDM